MLIHVYMLYIYIRYTCIEYHRVLNLKKNKWIFFSELFDQELLCLDSWAASVKLKEHHTLSYQNISISISIKKGFVKMKELWWNCESELLCLLVNLYAGKIHDLELNTVFFIVLSSQYKYNFWKIIVKKLNIYWKKYKMHVNKYASVLTASNRLFFCANKYVKWQNKVNPISNPLKKMLTTFYISLLVLKCKRNAIPFYFLHTLYCFKNIFIIGIEKSFFFSKMIV